MYNKKKTDIFCAIICYGFKTDASANICVQFSDLIVYKALLIFTVHLIYPDVKEAQCSFSTCLFFFLLCQCFVAWFCQHCYGKCNLQES